MEVKRLDQSGSEVRLHRILYFVKYLRAMVLNLVLVLLALALYAAAGTEGLYYMADETISALRAQIAALESQGNPDAAGFVIATAVTGGLATLGLFLWIYLAITNVWRRSLKAQALILLVSALFVPVWAWPQLQFSIAHLDLLFSILVALSFVLMLLLVTDVSVGLWRVASAPEASSLVATLDPRLTRGAWSYINKLLDLPRTPWSGWRNILAYLLSVAGSLLLIVAIVYLLSVGNVGSKLALLTASCGAANALECRNQSVAWAREIPPGLALAVAGVLAAGAIQSGGKWLGGLGVPEALAASGGRFILYLRPFDTDDDTLPKPKLPPMSRLIAFRPFPVRVEEELFDVADGYLPLIAIGRPGQSGQDKGGLAYRAYLSDAEWQVYVSDKINRADSIVMLLKNTEGVRWEIDKVLRDSVEEKTLFLFDPVARDPAVWDDLAPKMLAPFVAGGFLPQGFTFEGRPLGFYFRDGAVVEIVNENWSATSYRTAFSHYLAERADETRT